MRYPAKQDAIKSIAYIDKEIRDGRQKDRKIHRQKTNIVRSQYKVANQSPSMVTRAVSLVEFQVRAPKTSYSHLFNKRGGWNKRGGGGKVAKSLNVEAGINVEGRIFRKKLVHKSNKRGVEGGKI